MGVYFPSYILTPGPPAREAAMRLTRNDLRTFALDTLIFAIGSIFYALGLYTFATTVGFAPGGISGIALILNHFFNLPIGLVSLVLNIPLILISLKVIGKNFILKSIWTMLINALFLDLIFPLFPVYSGSPLLASMFTGVFVGVGLALTYIRGSSTGGSDFVIMTIKKIRPHFSVGQISLAFDAIVIVIGGFAFGSIDSVLYGIIASFATSKVIDSILYGAGSGKLTVIVTDHGHEIAEAIDAEVERGSTLVPATGAYTGLRRDMLLCACSKSEVYKVRTAARAVDPHSMIMITEASEVIGEGFDPPNIPGNEAPPPKNREGGDE